jgi:tetratricopeptide (TPR) repeat protein
MMAHFYLGLIRYLRKDYEGALASFRSAAAADQEGVSWQDVSDSPIVHLMAGKCHAHLGDKKEAKAAFDDAEKACGFRRISAEKTGTRDQPSGQRRLAGRNGTRVPAGSGGVITERSFL